MSRNAPAANPHPLRHARELKGWTTRELGERAGVAHTTIIRIENRRHQPSYRTLARIANALGLDDLRTLLAPWGAD